MCSLSTGTAQGVAAEGRVDREGGGKDLAYGQEGEGPCGVETGCICPQVPTKYPCTDRNCDKLVHDLCWQEVDFAPEAEALFGIQRRCSQICLEAALSTRELWENETAKELRKKSQALRQKRKRAAQHAKRKEEKKRKESEPVTGEYRPPTWTRLGRDRCVVHWSLRRPVHDQDPSRPRPVTSAEPSRPRPVLDVNQCPPREGAGGESPSPPPVLHLAGK